MLVEKAEVRRLIREKAVEKLGARPGAFSDQSNANAASIYFNLEAGRHLLNHLKQDEAFMRAQTVALFAALPDEVSTFPIHEFCAKEAKKIVYPLMSRKDKTLGFYPVRTNGKLHETMAKGSFGIFEPRFETSSSSISEIDLFLVPGLAFTRSGLRLGRGNGFYDRTLADPKFQQKPRYGIAFEWQVLESLPHESFDLSMHKVFTPKEAIDCAAFGQNRERVGK